MKFHQICHFGFCLHSCDFCRSKIGNQAISSENQTGNRIYLVMLLAHRSPKESFHIFYLLYMRPSQSQNVYSNLPLKDVSWREPLINSIKLDTLSPQFTNVINNQSKLSVVLTKFNQSFSWTNVFDRCKIKISVFINNGQLPVSSLTTLA